MKTLTTFTLLSFLLFSLNGCTPTDEEINEQGATSILGNWNIAGGGTLSLEEDSFSLSAGCNTLSGEVLIEENSLSFSSIVSTFMACPNESDAKREEALALLFENANLTYSIEEDQVQLYNAEGEVVIVLSRS